MHIIAENTIYRGIQRYSIKDVTIEAFDIERSRIGKSEYRDLDINGHGIYFLYGEDTEGKLKVYVGRSSETVGNIPIFTRLKQHNDSKTEYYNNIWTKAIAIKFKDLSFDEMRYLENYFFNSLRDEVKLNKVEPDTKKYKYEDIKTKVEYIKQYVKYILAEDVFKTEVGVDSQQDHLKLDYSDNEDAMQGKRITEKELESTTEVITYKTVIEQQLDMLPLHIWGPDTKFLDLACKGGEYLKAIFNRLMKSNLYKGELSNKIARAFYIMENQLYGVAITKNSYNMTLNNLPGIKNVIYIERDGYTFIDIVRSFNGLEKIAKKKSKTNQKNKELNLLTYLGVEDNNLKEYLGAKFGDSKMKFNVIIGNPPYQDKSRSIYVDFIEQSIKLNPDIINMIVKNNWLNSEVMVDTRNTMIENGLSSIINYPIAGEIFKEMGVSVSIFMTQKHNKSGYATFKEIRDGAVIENYTYKLTKDSIIIPNELSAKILHKITSNMQDNLGEYTYPAECFGINSNGTSGRGSSTYVLDTSNIQSKEKNIQVIYMDKNKNPYIEYISISDVPRRKEDVNKYKVVCGSVFTSDDNVIRNIHLIDKMSVTSKSWALVYASDDRVKAENVQKYLNTRFVRFIVKHFCGDGVNCISKWRFSGVPMQDFDNNSDIDWTASINSIDEQLYAKYNLSIDEISHIKSVIKEYK